MSRPSAFGDPLLLTVLSNGLVRNVADTGVKSDFALFTLLDVPALEPAAANGIFMIARLPGLVAHVIEQQQRNPPMRTVDVKSYSYDGP